MEIFNPNSSSFQVDPKYVRNLKFTKHHNRVARKNLVKARKAKLAGGNASGAGKVAKRAARPVNSKQTSWSLSSLLKNVTAYFTGESTQAQTKKRTNLVHPKKKSTKPTTTAAAVAAKK